LIDASKLEEAFRDCLFKDEEITGGQPPADAVLVEGIVNKFGFHPERLESHRQEIYDWLKQLPHPFRETEGGGWSFLKACDDAEGQQWGEHRNMEQLFCLGMGLGLAKSQLPRDLWAALPGGMPYYSIAVTD